MPLQNRVDPWGKLQAVPMRGSLMGNRGILHNESRQIVRPWAGKSWVSCALQFNGVHRTVFDKRTYSELFFLDEATAFAAGHRPCNYCRKSRYMEFKAAWLRANRPDVVGNIPITEVDKVLHAERAIPGGGKMRFSSALKDVPSGAIFEYENAAFLVWKGTVHRWSFDGYTPSSLQLGPQEVNVLTPVSIVRIYEAGFTPGVHASAEAARC
ncbi:MAG: hypothetical protein IH606_11890 [Burkholderiales bacterium]|nr:hypothetical protein [Burkholderiales bacterium]